MKLAVILLLFLGVSVSSKMTAKQKHRCEEYTSIFENDTTELQYSYCENIHDGRGYTAGRAGFCTGTGDAVEVIRKYSAIKPDNLLKKYIKELEILSKHESGDTSKLHGYCTAWKEAAKDPEFRKCQDEVSDEIYYKPAMHEANQANVQTPLGRCAFYDAIIQHGGGDDPDSLSAIIKLTKKTMNGVVNGNEKHWIMKFFEKRKYILQHAHNPDTRKEWAQSIDRVDAMIELANQNNWNLNVPMHIKTKDHDKTIKN
ncbi:chitosanase-like [Dermatophagoides pteronyssinus]|uniref:Uncharacterized protein LOC113793375 n=2 Tax=Dermatophagoides pteronyssinus TaxID=6956 RepID=A0A6P6Y1R3_DERPT|nr:uncharacterized protein LOC113793375 [Dermatophagoides pteronyssinus]KAH9419589.1 hypothetical protein DERP_009647 [Dermatophagoides pteronyssinus]